MFKIGQKTEINTIGFEKIKHNKETKIFVSNHVSAQDVLLLHDILPKDVHFFVKKEEYHQNEEKLKNRNCTVIDQINPALVAKIISIVKKGTSILLFPEHKISENGNLLQMYQELSFVALKSEVPVYPIIINMIENSDSSVPFSSIFNRLHLTTSSSVSIWLGEPFAFENLEEFSGEEQKNQANIYLYKKLNDLRFFSLSKTNVNLFDLLIKSAKSRGENFEIVKDLDGTLSYRKLLLSIHTMSNKLTPVLSKENPAGILLPSSIGKVIALFSLFKIGITPALLNFTMGTQNIVDCCKNANISHIITSKKFIQKANLQEVLDVLQTTYPIIYLEDVKSEINTMDKFWGLTDYTLSKIDRNSKNELIIFTSGSENKPKGVVLTHDNIYANIQQARTLVDIDATDKLMNILPAFHSFGLTIGMILPLLLGVQVLLYPTPLHYKEIPKLIYQESITILLGTSTFFQHYGENARPFDFRTLKIVIAGAEKLKDDVKTTWFEKCGVRIFEGYGVTEASPVLALNTPIFNKKHSVGLFLPGIDYKLESVEGIDKGGLLHIKGPNVMKGYLLHEKGFVPQDEWYNTGDVVEIDEYGFITIVSRLKRFAKIGGEMVSLNLVEELAQQCYESKSIATISLPDKRKGERIVLATTEEKLKERTLKKFIKEQKHSPLLFPSKFVTVESIPLLGSGKTDYQALRKTIEELL